MTPTTGYEHSLAAEIKRLRRRNTIYRQLVQHLLAIVSVSVFDWQSCLRPDGRLAWAAYKKLENIV